MNRNLKSERNRRSLPLRRCDSEQVFGARNPKSKIQNPKCAMPTNRVSAYYTTALKGTAMLFTSRRVPPRTRMHSLYDALRGLRDAWGSQPNLRLQVGISLGVIVLGMVVNLSLLEWLWVSFAIGLVIFAELMNTAIEQTIDLAVGLAPDPLARQVKDIAAGCVLVSVALAVVIGLLTFIPHLW